MYLTFQRWDFFFFKYINPGGHQQNKTKQHHSTNKKKQEYTYLDEDWIKYRTIELICCKPKDNVTLYANDTLKKINEELEGKKSRKQMDKWSPI